MLFDTYQTQNINRIYSGSGAVHGKITKIEHSKKQESKGCKCWNEHVIIAHIVKLFNKELIIWRKPA